VGGTLSGCPIAERVSAVLDSHDATAALPSAATFGRKLDAEPAGVVKDGSLAALDSIPAPLVLGEDHLRHIALLLRSPGLPAAQDAASSL
jgi:hypothetical protein